MGRKRYELTDSDFLRMRKVKQKDSITGDKKIYFSYNLRLFVMGLVTVLFYLGAILLIGGSFSKKEVRELEYNEVANVRFTTNVFNEAQNGISDPYLFNNTALHIDTDPEGEVTVIEPKIPSDTIDTEELDFYYYYKLANAKANYKYSYSVIGTLTVVSKNQGLVRTREYVLEDEVPGESDEEVVIKPSVLIDYKYYNNLVKELEREKGEALEASFDVSLITKVVSETDSFDNTIMKTNEYTSTLPLNVESVKLEDKEFSNKQGKVKETTGSTMNKPILMFSGISCIIFGTVSLLILCSFVKKADPVKTRYEMLRDGILKDYNKIIVNTKKMPKLNKFNVIDCWSFNELLDAQNTLNKPIIYYEITVGIKAIFFILNDGDVYQFVLKKADTDYE